MDYWVIHVASPYPPNPGYVLSYLFASPFQAEEQLKRLGYSGDSRYSVRSATWQEREDAMFNHGLYERPVWEGEGFWISWGTALSDHFVHISVADPSTIAFTEDERKGEADRQTLMKPGKYLQKYLGGGADGLIEHGPLKGQPAKITKQQVAYYAAWHKQGRRPTSDDTLHFTDDPKEMIRVYRAGPYSCMRGCDKDWPDDDHPVQVYAAGDLKMAYLNNVSGEVVARALCWPEKGTFNRVYPTPNNDATQLLYDQLHQRLKDLGWTSITERQSVFEGARLKYVTNRWGQVIMPYLDHEYGVEQMYPQGEPTYWRMTHDASHQDSTSGTMDGEDHEDEPDWTCGNCDEGFSEDHDSRTVYSGWFQRGAGRGYSTGEQVWCDGCANYGTFYCEGAEEYFQDSCDQAEVGYNTYNLDWLRGNGGWQCSHSEEWFFRDDDTPVTLADGGLVHAANLRSAAFQCLADGQWWPEDYNSLVVPGYSCVWDTMVPHPVEVELTLPDQPVHPEDIQAWAAAYDAAGHLYSPSPWAMGQRRLVEVQLTAAA